MNGTHRTIQGWHTGESRQAAIPTSNHSSAQHPHPKARGAVIRPHNSTGTQTERSQNISWNRVAQAALGKGFGRRRGEDRIKIKPNRKKNSVWGRYHGRLHWGCFFCSAYYTGFVVALWLRQKNMVLVPLLGSRGSKKMTILLTTPTISSDPTLPTGSITKKREEGGVLPGLLDIIPPPEAIAVVRDVPKSKYEWTASAIRKENRRQKGSSPKGWGESCNEH